MLVACPAMELLPGHKDIVRKIVSELENNIEAQAKALFHANGDKFAQKIISELQKVTEAQFRSFSTSLGAQLQGLLEKSVSVVTKTLVLAISLFLAIYIWRQLEEERRAREVHARNMQPRLCETCRSEFK